MLSIIRSNRVEQLLAELARQLVAQPPDSPFAPAIVVTPSPAMARWVNLRLASVCGVAANVRYPLPAGFVWRLAKALLDDLPDTDPLSLEAMAWRIFTELPALLPDPAFARLQGYLNDDPDGRKRWQLARRIADVYDRCQLYRPALMAAWAQGADADADAEPAQAHIEPWQPPLWRRLVAGQAQSHRVAMLDRLLATLSAQPPADALPQRLALFAVSSLPPVLVQVYQALARHIPVDLYLHTPTDQFWSDLVSQKALARKRLAAPQQAELWEVRNPLLGSWGRQGQALQDLLLQGDNDPTERDAHVPDWPDTLLGALQRDLFELKPVPPTPAPIPPDDSVQVHLCHSPARECQALHDALLAMFEAEPDLRPEDVLVMVPEIGRYAADIEAVFDRHRPQPATTAEATAPGGAGAAPAAPFIPWNLSDIAVVDEHPLVRVFLRLLALPESRFTQSEVLAYLDVPELAARFDLDANALAQVRDWLAAANLRWGLDGDHKAAFGLPATAENTWAQAEQRLFGGYALGDAAAFAGIAPAAGVEGKAAAALGGFWRCLDRLRTAARALAAPRPAVDWQRDLTRLVADFFGERDDPDGRLQRMRDAIAELAEQAAAVPEPLSLPLVRAWLEERLGADGGERRGGRYFSGGVTFCGMRPMRSLPFQVICVLGLDDEPFPRRERPLEFDPMRHAWRPGDPRRGDEDRYLFLETLLGARRRLYLSCVGRDIRSNAERQPSVLLRELLDHIDQYYVRVNGGKLSAAITRVHPLQPFSAARFARGDSPARAEDDQRSFDADWARIAEAVHTAPAARPGSAAWPEDSLPPPADGAREVTLVQLERFLAHPLRYFVQTRLKVHLAETEPEPDDEVFDLNRLTAWQLRARLLQDHLAERETTAERLSAEGVLPHGAFADLTLEAAARRAAPLKAALADFVGCRPAPLELDLVFDDQAAGPGRLTGRVAGLYPAGLLHWRAGKLRGAHRLGLWLAHLARWAVTVPAADADPPPSVLHAEDGSFVLPEPLPQDQARARLGELLALYRQGLHRPLPIFPNASFAFAAYWQRDDPRAQAKALAEARKAWFGDSFSDVPGEGEDPYIRLMLRGVDADPLESAEFARLALMLYEPLLAAGEDR
jgi:exodeoxyribonuclease V gamma subunit